jgi:hypothetical protein
MLVCYLVRRNSVDGDDCYYDKGCLGLWAKGNAVQVFQTSNPPDPDYDGQSYSGILELHINDDDLGLRLLKAFRHLIKLAQAQAAAPPVAPPPVKEPF